MDSPQEDKHIAKENDVFLSFDSSDFSANVVHVHTEHNESPLKSNLAKDDYLSTKNKFDGAKLVSSSEYNQLRNSTTSFNKWFSQTTLLGHLVEEASPVSTDSLNYLKKDSFFLEGDAGKEDEFYNEYGLFFERSNDGTLVNKSVVTFLMSSFSSPDDYKHVTLEQGMTSDFNEFKLKFLELLNDESNELKFKRALLTVAFNHYGCSVVKKFMTLDEYMTMLNVHKVFQNESMPKFVFDSMDRKYKSMLTLNEFVSGMLSCSPEANHNLSTSFGKLRLQHVFRAYDLNRLGYLHQHSLELMLNHLSQLSGDSEYFSNLDELSENLLSLFNGKLSYDSFYYCVENDVLKDTRFLFRSNHDMAKSVKDFLFNALSHVLPAEKAKPKGTTLFNRTSLDSDLSEQTQMVNQPLNRDFTFGSYSEKPKPYETNTYENSNVKPTGSPVNRHSIWSHTPRVYSEFSANKSPVKDSLYNFNYGSNWSKTSYSPQSHGTQKPQNPIDRVSAFYNDEEKQMASNKDHLHTDTQTQPLVQDHQFTTANEHTPNNGELNESDRVFEDNTVQRSVERTVNVSRQESEDLFVDAFHSKLTASAVGNSKLDELLNEYNLQPKTPENSGTTQHKPFANLKDVDLFEDVFEDESQFLGKTKEPAEVFTPFSNSKQLSPKENPFKSTNKDGNDHMTLNKDQVQEQAEKAHDYDHVNHDLLKDPVGVTNEVTNEVKTFDDPVDYHTGLKGEKDGLDQNVVSETGESKPLGTEAEFTTSDPTSGPATTTNVALEPDTGCSGSLSKQGLNYSTLETFTEQLSKFYKSKFLIFKGLLTDDSVAKSVFTKFLLHSLGDSTDHDNLDLCTFSDMLQLCDSVCCLLRKENSLLNLKGDFQVFASLNGDLSCLLDFFNTYGWPMVKKKFLDELNFKPNLDPNLNLNLKNNNWMDFDHSYLFMGGFVSDLSSISLEFVMFMFSLKVLFPYHVYFLRSSKDERSFSNDAGFYDEVYRKLSRNHSSFKIFNDETFVLQCSKELFHRVNDVFEFMSVAAVLNNDVLCVDKLTNDFSYSKLANLPKPLSLSTCDQEQVYDLLFNRSHQPLLVNLHLDHLDNNDGNNNSNNHNDNNSKQNNHVNSTSTPDPYPNPSPYSVKLTNDQSSVVKFDTLFNLQNFNMFKLVLCCSDDLDSGYKQLMDNKLLLLSTNFNKKKNNKMATTLVFNGSKLTYRSLKL